MISEIEEYFSKGCGRCDRFGTPDCSTRRWTAGLAELRRICRAAGLAEVVKWGHPCYVHHGRNIALIGAFRADFRLTLMEAALLADPAHLLEKPGPNTQVASMIRFDDAAEVRLRETAIAGLLAQGMAHAEAGLRAPRAEGDLELPAELVAALDDDPELAEAFAVLTRGRQRSYAIALSSAKTSATRVNRIAGLRDRILAGKGANER